MVNSVPCQFDELTQAIRTAELTYGRDPGSVILLAVSKTRTVDEIRTIIGKGQRDFGENYLQDALPKMEALSESGLTWHFIGHLQSNKTKTVAGLFDWVHTIDRTKIALRLNDQRPDSIPPLNVCIEVNISDETSKSGVTAAEAAELAQVIADAPRLRLRGLMALPALTTDPDSQRIPFRKLHRLMETLNKTGHQMDTLAMGTTNDYVAAIAEGATIVRVGTAIFGPRRSRD